MSGDFTYSLVVGAVTGDARMKAFYALIDDHIKEYEQGTILISEDIPFSMRKTVKQITHYILSRCMGGGSDISRTRSESRDRCRFTWLAVPIARSTVVRCCLALLGWAMSRSDDR